MERSGRCLCGDVQFTAHLKNDKLGACHCGMCRRWTGGPLVSILTTDMTWHQTESLRTYSSSEWAERGFCGTCGSSLFYRLKAQGTIHLAAGSLDDLTGLVLDHEVFIDHRPDGYRFAGELHGMTEAEIFAKYAPQ